MKSKSYYFRIAFTPIFAGLLAARFVYLLLSHWNDKDLDWGETFLMSLVFALLTAAGVGLFNIFAKYDLKNKSSAA